MMPYNFFFLVITIIILIYGQTKAQLIEEVLTFPHCQLCCERGDPGPPGIQGSPGSQGVSGAPGIHGLHGEPGSKGEIGFIGFKGRKGERGPKGDRGDVGIPTAGGLNLKGDSGQKGEKGETGTTGSVGRSGDQGLQGAKGQKGQKGKKGSSAVSPVPAFYVRLTTGNFSATQQNIFIFEGPIVGRAKRQFVNEGPILVNPGLEGDPNNIIPFDEIILNEEDCWDKDEFYFITPIAGSYLFTATIYKHHLSPYVAADLYTSNFGPVASTIDQNDQSDSATMTAVVQMNRNDRAWVEAVFPGSVYGEGETTFSGLKIH